MIKTTRHSLEDIPEAWIFEHYLNISLTKPLMIHSVFNEKDKNPSMRVEKKGNRTLFYDFSTGICGSGVDLVMKMFNLEFKDARDKIINDYFNDVQYVNKEYNYTYFAVTEMIPRVWNNIDINYWGSYGISKMMLERYNVIPLSSYVMSNETESFHVEYPKCYAYCNSELTPYKIYQPGKKRKFLKVMDTIQGLEQLTYTKNILIICSSLKDLMCVETCLPEVECIAPDSENSTLPKDIIDKMKSRYKKVFTLFDNDTAGLMNMYKYKRDFGIDFLKLNIKKDVADCTQAYGIKNTREILKQLLLWNIQENTN